MKKQLLILLPALALALSMGACKRKQSTSVSQNASTPTSQTTSQTTSGNTSQGSSGTSSANTSSEGTSSEGTSQGGSSSETSSEGQQQAVYSLTIGETNYQFADVSSDKGELDTWVAQYKASALTFAAGAELVVKKDGERIYPGASGDGNNGSYNEETHVITARNAAENADFYLKVYEDGYDSWLTGYQAPVVTTPVYRVVGTMNEWSYDNSTIAFVDATVAEEVEQEWYVAQLKATFDVAADAEFKVRDQSENWLGGDILEANAKFEVLNTEGHEGNIKAKEAGTVELFLKNKANDVKALAINFTPVPVVHDFKYKLGDAEAAALTKNEEAVLATNQTAQYEAKGVALTAGQALVFYDGAVEISENLGSDPEDDTNKNNGVFNAGAITIHNDAASADIYFKTWQDGGFSYWVTGYEAPAPASYKVIGLAAGEHPWAYEDSTIVLVDATVQSEVEAHQYKTQLKAEFNVAANDEFKLYNGTTYVGGEVLEANAKFEVLHTEGHENNIKALEAGSVELFFKTLEDDSLSIFINFTPAPVVVNLVEYTVTSVPVAWTDASDYFAWAWGGASAGSGKAYEATLSGTSISAELPDTINCFLLVKVAKDATFTGASAEWTSMVQAQSRNFVEFDKDTVSYPFEAPLSSLTISVTYDTGDGFSIYLIGDFCDWDITSSDKIALGWTAGNVWTVTTNVPYGEYHVKLVKAPTVNPTSVTAWEKDGMGTERVVTIKEATVVLNLEWGNY